MKRCAGHLYLEVNRARRMAPYVPLVVCRSDGVQEYVHNGISTPNQPKPKDLEATPNAQGLVSIYKKVGPDDMKALQWRRKLAGMLMELLGGTKHKSLLPLQLNMTPL